MHSTKDFLGCVARHFHKHKSCTSAQHLQMSIYSGQTFPSVHLSNFVLFRSFWIDFSPSEILGSFSLLSSSAGIPYKASELYRLSQLAWFVSFCSLWTLFHRENELLKSRFFLLACNESKIWNLYNWKNLGNSLVNLPGTTLSNFELQEI